MTTLLESLGGAFPAAGIYGHCRVGLDAESIPECVELLGTASGRALLDSRFTDDERAYIDGDAARFAGRWALKEAVVKAVGTGFRGLRPLDVEILREPNGRPVVQPPSGATWPGGSHRWAWSISLARAGDAAIAIAVGVDRTPPSSGEVS